MVSAPKRAAAVGASLPRNFAAIAEQYARTAVEDRKNRSHCRWVRLAAKRHLDDLRRSRNGAWDYVFDEWHANDACGFIEKLPHVEGSWDRATIDLEPAQIFMLAVAFGWRNRATGKRRFTAVYIELARKNAKSTLAAGVALYCLTCEGEIGPQVIIGATTGEQAQKVFRPAKLMVEKTPALREAFNVQAFSRSITCLDNGGFIQTINAKSTTQDGWNPHVGMLDELHAHKDRGLYDVIRSAFGARKNPLLWIITTAGYDVMGVCYEQRTLVTKILEGIIKADHYFGVIYTLDDKDDEFDPSVWIKANPLLGKSVQLGDLKAYAIEAKASPDSHGEYLTKRMNVWTRAKRAHVNVKKWLKCGTPVDIAALAGKKAWGGLDLASTEDLCAFRLVFNENGKVQTWGRFYCPEETVLPRTERGNVPYRAWAEAGKIVITPGAVTDYDWIKKDIEQALKDFQIQGIAYDPWGAQQIVNDLAKEGAPMVAFRQGIPSYTGPMKELDRLYLKRELEHGGDEVLAWNASNVVARRDVNTNIAPDKSKSQEKIDGYCALVMALGLMLGEENEGPGFTATHGVVRL